MRYESECAFRGDRDAALRAAEGTLLANGFRLVDSGPGRNLYAGRGLNSSRENPIRGATRLELTVSGATLRLQAELGGVKRMGLFVCIFPIVLWAGLTLAPLIATGGDRMQVGWAGIVGTAIWLVLGPLLAWRFRRRTEQALDDLLQSAAAVAAREA